MVIMRNGMRIFLCYGRSIPDNEMRLVTAENDRQLLLHITEILVPQHDTTIQEGVR